MRNIYKKNAIRCFRNDIMITGDGATAHAVNKIQTTSYVKSIVIKVLNLS